MKHMDDFDGEVVLRVPISVPSCYKELEGDVRFCKNSGETEKCNDCSFSTVKSSADDRAFEDSYINQRIIDNKLEKFKSNPTIHGMEIPFERIKDGTVSLEDYKAMRGNSYVWRNILRKLNNSAMNYVVRNYMSNVTSIDLRGNTTYEEILLNNVVPQLLKRLGEDKRKITDRIVGGDYILGTCREEGGSLREVSGWVYLVRDNYDGKAYYMINLDDSLYGTGYVRVEQELGDIKRIDCLHKHAY